MNVFFKLDDKVDFGLSGDVEVISFFCFLFELDFFFFGVEVFFDVFVGFFENDFFFGFLSLMIYVSLGILKRGLEELKNLV